VHYIELRDPITKAVYKHHQVDSTFTTIQIMHESGKGFQTISHRFDDWLELGIIEKVGLDKSRQARPSHIYRLNIEKFEEHIGKVKDIIT